MMYRDPGKIGLVILGASEFDHYPKLRRKAFRNACKRVKDFFLDADKGPGLSERTIFEAFDLDAEKKEILSRMQRFIDNTRIEELFLYLCSHGADDEGRLKILLKKSRNIDHNEPEKLIDNSDWESYVDFNSLIVDIISTSEECGQIYCIVDCCFSGYAHNKKFERQRYSDYHYPDNEEIAESGDFRGAAILTSNNKEVPGGVIASDDLPGIEVPLFTHILLQLLWEGVPNQYGDGFAFEHLHALADDRIPATIDKINEGSKETAPIVSDKQRKACVPEVSDRLVDSVTTPERVTLPSRVRVFANNHSQYVVKAAYARRMRRLRKKARENNEEHKRMEDTIEDMSLKNENMERRINEQLDRIGEMQGEIDSLRSEKREMESIMTAQSKRVQEMEIDIAKSKIEKEETKDHIIEYKSENESLMQEKEVLMQKSRFFRGVSVAASCIASALVLYIFFERSGLMTNF